MQHGVRCDHGFNHWPTSEQFERGTHGAGDAHAVDLDDIAARKLAADGRHTRSPDPSPIRRARDEDVEMHLALHGPGNAVEVGDAEKIGRCPTAKDRIGWERGRDRMSAQRWICRFRVTTPKPDATGGQLPQRAS